MVTGLAHSCHEHKIVKEFFASMLDNPKRLHDLDTKCLIDCGG